jgi:hypothetical protein
MHLFLLISTTIILFIPILKRIDSQGRVDLRDPIYLFLTGFFLYLVLSQFDTRYSTITLGNDFSYETKLNAAKIVFLSACFFCIFDFALHNKKLDINLNYFSFNKKSAIIFFSLLSLISISFMYLNLSRFGNFFEFIFSGLSKGERYYKMRQIGNFPFDIFFQLSFITGILLVNFYKKNIYKSILITILIFSPYLLYKLYVFDRSLILKYFIIIFYFIVYEKKLKIKLLSKKNIIYFFCILFLFYVFSKTGEIRKPLHNFIAKKEFSFSNFKKLFAFNEKNYLREFRNTNLGFLYLIENKDFIKNDNRVTYFNIFYHNIPRTVLKKLNNIKEKNDLDFLGEHFTNMYWIGHIERINPISITHHPLTEAFYNFKSFPFLVFPLIYYLTYKFILSILYCNSYFLSRSALLFIPLFFIGFRSSYATLMTATFYFFIYLFIYFIIDYCVRWLQR